MWIVAIAWMYVAVMMTMAEATSPQGTVLGAVITLVFYGLLPMALVMYLLGAFGRRKVRLAREAQERAQHVAMLAAQQAPQPPSFNPSFNPSSKQTDAGSLPPGDAIAPEGKKP
jgi:Na+-transporting methylmalonyl-CoA/oxaloacetate decarboxylase gamma subunit